MSTFKHFEKLTPQKKRELEILKKYWFFDPTTSPRESCMCFGLEVSEGWFDIIEQLCDKIEQYINKEHPEYKTGECPFSVVQVKEKFGGLRFYTRGGDEIIEKFIDKAQEKSYKTCEKCGKKGKLREGLVWMLTLCDKHYKEKIKE